LREAIIDGKLANGRPSMDGSDLPKRFDGRHGKYRSCNNDMIKYFASEVEMADC